MNRIDRFIYVRLLMATLMVLGVLIFVFIIIDFSENSDSFTDRGATMAQIWGQYYWNYIPEMIRLVSPMAVFVAVLLVAGQMTDRLELTAIKGAGVSLYRFMLPFLVFSLGITAAVSYLDGFVIPGANSERIAFEREFLTRTSDRIDRSRLYRQESEQTIVTINYFDVRTQSAYQTRIIHFEGDQITQIIDAARMDWQEDTKKWRKIRSNRRVFNETGFDNFYHVERDTLLNILPRDIARTTSDIYQLTYPEILDYLASLRRSGVGGIALPQVQFYSKLFYPFGIFVISLIGLGISTQRRKGGRGVLLGIGLIISFFYLAFMKLMEPFGSSGQIDPLTASVLPHAVFFFISLLLIWRTPK
ncbi:MAG: LptF/LptG family permease [Balneolales bacterium]|nr:LptF/LptG family permease [Balneolales bacterium]